MHIVGVPGVRVPARNATGRLTLSECLSVKLYPQRSKITSFPAQVCLSVKPLCPPIDDVIVRRSERNIEYYLAYRVLLVSVAFVVVWALLQGYEGSCYEQVYTSINPYICKNKPERYTYEKY